jgi:hypothetical protein
VSAGAVWDPHPLSRFDASTLWRTLLLSASYSLRQSVLRGRIRGCASPAGSPALDVGVPSLREQRMSSRATGGACRAALTGEARRASRCGVWVCYVLNMFINYSADTMICVE